MFKELFKKRRPLHIPGDAELRNLTSVDPWLAALYLEEAMGIKHPTWPLHVAHWTALAAFFAFLWWASFAWAFPYQYLGACAVPAFLLLCLSYSQVPFRYGLRRPAVVLAIAVVSLSAYVGAFLFAYAWISSSLEAEKTAYLAATARTKATVLWSFRNADLDVDFRAYSYSAPDGRHFGIRKVGYASEPSNDVYVEYSVSKPGLHTKDSP